MEGLVKKYLGKEKGKNYIQIYISKYIFGHSIFKRWYSSGWLLVPVVNHCPALKTKLPILLKVFLLIFQV